MRENISFRKGSIGRRLVGLVLAALGAAFLITSISVAWTDARRQAAAETQRLAQTARVIAALSAESVEARDSAGAFRALRSIGQMPEVNYGRLDQKDGRTLAEIGGGARLLTDASVTGGDNVSLWDSLTSGSIQVVEPVVVGDRAVGRITLFAETPQLQARVLAAIWASLLGAGIATLAGLLIALRMSRKIATPIVSLAGAVTDMGRRQDYSQDAKVEAEGEVGALVEGVNGMLASIRERDAAIEAHVAGLEQTVADRTRELSVARDAAEQANAAKSDFLAVMSHEIRTPMNGILALSELLAASDLPGRQRRYADVIAKSGRSLLSIINDILDFSKVEAGKMDLETIDCDLAEIAEDVAGLFHEKAYQKGLDLAVFVDPRLPDAATDPTRLRQVISNLVNNAIKFTETGGVLIEVRPDPERARHILIGVRDTGPGIAPDVLPKLFEAFSQADQTTTRKHGGTGLGLAICDRLVKAMDGEWKLASTVGKGSMFAFTAPLLAEGAELLEPPQLASVRLALSGLPPLTAHAAKRYLAAWGVAPATAGQADAALGVTEGVSADRTVLVCATDAEAEAAPIPAKAATALVRPLRRSDLAQVIGQLARGETPHLEMAAGGPATGGIAFPSARVLVVDDAEVNREVAAEALALLEITPMLVEGGQEAIDAVRVQDFDLVLMDGSMPGMDGFEATRRIRAEEAETGRPRTRVVALTAHVVGAAAQAWREADMDGVIHKPFTLADLIGALQDACPDKAATPVAAAAVAGGPKSEAASPAPTLDETLFDAKTQADLAAMAAGGNPDFVSRIEALYRDNAPRRMAEAVQAHADGDAEALSRAAHALKSISLSLGARAVSDRAATLEHDARAGAAVDARALQDIAEALARTLKALDRQPSAEPVAIPVEIEPKADPLVADVLRGLERGEFHLVYQPLVDRTGATTPKAEALIRWEHPERGRVSPDNFIPQVEAAGEIARITDFALETAMRDCADIPGLIVGVNASASEFQMPGFADRVVAICERLGFDRRRLEVEVTETAMLDVEAARHTVDTLRAAGVNVALDDFGAGFTSLHALKELRFTTLKIDRSFVDHCTDDVASASIIHAVIGVGRALGMKVVCEGVETAAQADFLRIAGAHYLQGYYFAKPGAVSELKERRIATAA
ncbi:EAL domain-containing protein [Brevundimonas lutea]|uniref:EAL domain-containing protein n=1 Tax=Brevundimonas lutea TaxID=2293980 RepID=UPI0013CF396C|nr:EAL domain-containing protein [Brevundimonas lutea]